MYKKEHASFFFPTAFLRLSVCAGPRVARAQNQQGKRKKARDLLLQTTRGDSEGKASRHPELAAGWEGEERAGGLRRRAAAAGGSEPDGAGSRSCASRLQQEAHGHQWAPRVSREVGGGGESANALPPCDCAGKGPSHSPDSPLTTYEGERLHWQGVTPLHPWHPQSDRGCSPCAELTSFALLHTCG